MAEWTDFSDSEIESNPDAKEARKTAFANVFYASKDGQDVLFALERYYDTYPVVLGAERAKMAIREFLDYIRDCCGLDDLKAVIENEAKLVT